MRGIITDYISKMIQYGHTILRCIARALKIPEEFFQETITYDPTYHLCLFNYPPTPNSPEMGYGVGQHTDYGLVIFVCIDNTGGLQLKTMGGQWINVPVPEPGKHSIVVNIGDMMEKISKGRYRSTPHRVLKMT